MKKGITGYVFGALVLTLAGAVCLAASVFDRRIARTQQNVAAMKYDDPDGALEAVERYFEYGSRLPWVGSGSLNDVRARRAALHYWQHRYDLLIPDQGDPIGALPPDNIELQLVVANAVYRAGQARATDQATTLRALDAAINAYLAVLKNAGHHPIAAYNYEYLERLRDDIVKGRRTPDLTDTAEDGPAGRQGGPPPPGKGSDQRNFKILVPLEPGEMDKAAEPGKGTPIERKG
jgi:hypothetical protein